MLSLLKKMVKRNKIKRIAANTTITLYVSRKQFDNFLKPFGYTKNKVHNKFNFVIHFSVCMCTNGQI